MRLSYLGVTKEVGNFRLRFKVFNPISTGGGGGGGGGGGVTMYHRDIFLTRTLEDF